MFAVAVAAVSRGQVLLGFIEAAKSSHAAMALGPLVLLQLWLLLTPGASHPLAFDPPALTPVFMTSPLHSTPFEAGARNLAQFLLP